MTPTPISQYGFFGGVDFGWDWRTYVVVLMYLTRNFVVNMCIKKFDATIKNICSASATIAVYVIGIMLNIERFAVHKIFSFVVLIALVGLFFQAENIEFHSAGDGLRGLRALLARARAYRLVECVRAASKRDARRAARWVVRSSVR